jgi:hypothetical protein
LREGLQSGQAASWGRFGLAGWFKWALPNALLACASVAACYLLLELLFFRIALPLVPFNVRTHLPEVPDVLVQNTKRGYVPHDYIALLGDSYADGLGDWLLKLNGNRGEPFQSANIIHDLIGRDVVSFGKGPGGSAQGLVLRPARIFNISECYLFPRIEEPSRMFYYYFEGNDVEDDLAFIEIVRKRYGRADADDVDRYLNEEYGAASAWRCHRHFADTVVRMAKFAFQYYVQKKDLHWGGHTENTVTIAGQPVLAAPLYGPALGLSAQQLETGLTIFGPSLAWLRRRFPNVPVTVVYIPSPLTVYAHMMPRPVALRRASSGATLAQEDDNGVPAAELADRTSDRICERIRSASMDRGADFVDIRSKVRKAAAARPLHGPIDWSHFNEDGYRLLGSLVSERIRPDGSDPPCALTN